jgi:MSHA pilin protein MshC
MTVKTQVQRGFTLIELIAVMVIVGVMSVSLSSRLGSMNSTKIQAGRDDLIAALFFAQQTAMARSGIQLIVTTNAVSVTENGTPIIVHSQAYPLSFSSGVTATTPLVFTYDKLGRTTAAVITLAGTGGFGATVTVEASGYAH